MKLQNTIQGTRPDVHFNRLDATAPEVAVYLDGFKYHATTAAQPARRRRRETRPAARPRLPASSPITWDDVETLGEPRTAPGRPGTPYGGRRASRSPGNVYRQSCPARDPAELERPSGPTRSSTLLRLPRRPRPAAVAAPRRGGAGRPARARRRRRRHRRLRRYRRPASSAVAARRAAARPPRRRPDHLVRARTTPDCPVTVARRRPRKPAPTWSALDRRRRPAGRGRRTSAAHRQRWAAWLAWGNVIQFLGHGGGDGGQLADLDLDAFDPALAGGHRGHRSAAHASAPCRWTRRPPTWLGATRSRRRPEPRTGRRHVAVAGRARATSTRTSPTLEPLVQRLAAQDLPAPVVGYELGDQGWQAELAWPDAAGRRRARRSPPTIRRPTTGTGRTPTAGWHVRTARRMVGRRTGRTARATIGGDEPMSAGATLRMLDRADKEVMKLARADDRARSTSSCTSSGTTRTTPGCGSSSSRATPGCGPPGSTGTTGRCCCTSPAPRLPPRRGQAPQRGLRRPRPVRVPDQPGHRRHRGRRPGTRSATASSAGCVPPAPDRPPSRQPADAPPLFAAYTDDQLLELGVAEPLLPSIAQLTTEDELLGLARLAPQLTADVLLALYDGTHLRRGPGAGHRRRSAPTSRSTPRTSAGGPGAPPPRSPPTTRPCRRCSDEALRPLEGLPPPRPSASWSNATTTARPGSAAAPAPARPSSRCTGSSTSPSSCRPAPTSPILLTTFNRNLAADLRTRLLALGGPELAARVDIVNIDRLASRVVAEAERGRKRRVIDDSQGAELWARLLAGDRRDPLGRRVPRRRMDPGDPRPGARTPAPTTSGPAGPDRGRSLTRAERDQVWQLAERFTNRLDDTGRLDLAAGRRAGRRLEIDARASRPARGRDTRAGLLAAATATSTSSWTRRRTSAPPTGRCCAPWSPPARTTCSSPATPTSASTTTT